MASPSFLRTSTRPDLYICARCSLRAARSPSRTTRRWVGQKYLAKVANAEYEWAQHAVDIQMGKRKSMLAILEERELVNQITGKRSEFEARLTEDRLGAYVGIDPTASSLHVGHLLPFMALSWMYLHGYSVLALLGGATAKIGDPTDRLKTREMAHSSVRAANMVSMHFQLKKFMLNIDSYGRTHGFFEGSPWEMRRALSNNNEWWNKMPLLEVLQVLGHGVRLGPMLARETVKNKMNNGDGMSFAEFTYPLMQAWDWWHLFSSRSIHMQIGGADQYGNITAGIDAIKHISKHHPNPAMREKVTPLGDPLGFTVPLLTTSSGQKFGKSAGNAIWLDSDQTSPFEFYGYFLRTSDADVGKYLKMLTFVPIDEINELVEEHMVEPSKRKAQHRLAREIVEIVHGPHEAKVTEEQHRFLFNKSPDRPAMLEVQADPDTAAGYVTLNNKPKINVQLPRSVIETLSIGRILFAAGLAASATEGHRLAQHDGAFIGGIVHSGHKGSPNPMTERLSWTKIKPWHIKDTAKYLVYDDLLMLRRGKHHIRVVQVVPDDEFLTSGKTYPGQKLSTSPLSNLEQRNKQVLDQLKTDRGKMPDHAKLEDPVD
ncbi:hypothetical protein BJ875DRAFT_535277 [Amylocarpus encephaloides]|uniref:Tyrosine--tRNA ligase n=1 Tax=Amylocarpus encephaloides TaxID=45428 RepID=A0A9P7YHJ4_9HELO|nr:hypothetical protein BJ875DRAFT_535277 [Amylocarpus encephaloides]